MREYFTNPHPVLTSVLAGLFFISAVVNAVSFVQLVSALERLGHQFEPWTLEKYKNGFLTTLREYKRFQIAENKPLTFWWLYWASLWTVILSWLGIFVTMLSADLLKGLSEAGLIA